MSLTPMKMEFWPISLKSKDVEPFMKTEEV